MQVPIGRSGVQAVPKTRHSHGLIAPISTSPHWQAFGSSTRLPGSSKRASASQSASSGLRRSALRSIQPRPRHSNVSRSSIVSSSAASARGLPSRRTTRVYWFSTAQRPSRNWRSSMTTACRMSSGSKAVTTTGLPYSSTMKSYGRVPITVETWPGAMNASSRRPGESRIARSGGPIVTWLQKAEKLRTSSARARSSVSAVAGAVVSKPIAKKTTSRSGFRRASSSASSGE